MIEFFMPKNHSRKMDRSVYPYNRICLCAYIQWSNVCGQYFIDYDGYIPIVTVDERALSE